MKKVLLLMALCAGLNAGETNAQDLMDVKIRLESISHDVANASSRLSIVELEQVKVELNNMLSQTQGLLFEADLDNNDVIPVMRKIKVEMENIESSIKSIVDFNESCQLKSRTTPVTLTDSASNGCQCAVQ